MGKIKQLSLHEAQKIAAGEVVERPANVVKELIENSIDANAQKISVYINESGQSLIRIVDNGCGMSAEDAQICFHHHATSKINSVNDLPSLQSFGFRGEALASISAVSSITLITKEQSAQHGIQIIRSAGAIEKVDEVASPGGTDISVKDLFFNVPARKKFLTSTQSEWRQILHLFHAFCFDYPEIHFSLYADDKLVHNCPPVTNLIDRAYQLWDSSIAQHMIAATHSHEQISISGIISHYQYCRYDRSYINFFVNKRWIKNQHLGKALLKGYLNVIPPDRFPAATLSISLDPASIDVNIHPRKQEVQFLHPRIVESMITTCVKKALENAISHKIRQPVSLKPAFSSSFGEKQHQQPFFDMPPTKLFNHTIPPISMPKQSEASYDYFSSAIAKKSFEPISQEKMQENETKQLTELPEITIIGHYKKTYIITETEDGLFIIDQHAAHERVLYEQFRAQFGSFQTVPLLFPHIIQLTESEFLAINTHFNIFAQYGIGVESFGHHQIIIQSTPIHLKHIAFSELIKEVISIIQECNQLEKEQFQKIITERVHAQMACKAAVKAGDELSRDHMQSLLRDLQKVENRFACPHGRPTGWLLSLDEIEKKFKRKK